MRFLSNEFLAGYKSREVEWGFSSGPNSIGEITYRRTYSRPVVVFDRKYMDVHEWKKGTRLYGFNPKKLETPGLRWKDGKLYDDEGTKFAHLENEVWWETVMRVVEGVYEILYNHCKQHDLPFDTQLAISDAQEMYERIFTFKFTPPGRGLWMCGTDFVRERGGMALNNCSFVSTRDIDREFSEPFRFLMDVSMLGVGCGFDTKGAGKLTWLPDDDLGILHVVVEDSREGWVGLIGALIDWGFGKGPFPVPDLSLIRKYGEPICGFGGVASGPEPLRQLYDRILQLIRSRSGQLVSSRDIVDIMNMIGVCVVAGNVRRTAEVALGEYGDQEFLDLKNYTKNPERVEWGWTSNNSVLVDQGVDYSDLAERTRINGEPGYFWLENVRAYSRMKDPPDYKDKRVMGGNPSLRKGTLVLTKEGVYPIEDLQDSSFEVPNLTGRYVPAKCWLSGENKPLWRISLKGGHTYYATGEHKWPVLSGESYRRVATSDLKIGDKLPFLSRTSLPFGSIGTRDEGFFVGYLQGNGWFVTRSDNGARQFGLCIGKDAPEIRGKLQAFLGYRGCNATFHDSSNGQSWELNSVNGVISTLLDSCGYCSKDHIPSKLLSGMSEEFRLGYIDGLFSADGCVSVKDKRVSISSSRESFLRELSVLLGFYGVGSTVSVRLSKAVFPNKKDYDRLYTKGELRVWNSSISQFDRVFSITHSGKSNRLARLYKEGACSSTVIEAVELTDLREDVWDISVDDVDHCFVLPHCVTGNCLEQSLESFEVCDLVENYISRHSSLEDFRKTLKYSFLYAKIIGLLKTHWTKTNAVMLRNRRIGCSISGVVEFLHKNSERKLITWLNEGYETVCKYDRVYSEWMAVRESIKKTSVKPSGTVSLLAGVTPGGHYPTYVYYIRRIRFAKSHPDVPALRDAGYHIESDVRDPYTLVVEFPVRGPDVPTEDQITIGQKLRLASLLQRHWADNQVSYTVTFSPDREGHLIKDNLQAYEDKLKAVSFLPLTPAGSYPQMPYEAITQEEYERRVMGLKKVVWGKSGISHDQEERSCEGGLCSVVTSSGV